MGEGVLGVVLALVHGEVGSSLNDDLARLIVIPAGYGLGSAVAGLAARLTSRSPEARNRWREIGGDVGAAWGLGVWLAGLS